MKSKDNRNPSFRTKAIHHRKDFIGGTGSLMPPIFQTSTFEFGNKDAFDYTRSGNPNFRILESLLNSLEESNYCTVFNSGISAITAIASSLKSNDIILCEKNLYGCTIRLFEQVFKKFGIKSQFIDFTNSESYKTIDELNPQLIWIETPTNPLLKIVDIKNVCLEANKKGIPVVVDNTFCTSYIQKPIELGATLSLISTTKFINGHSDALGGAVMTMDKAWNDKLKFAQKSLGLQPSPMDCWLTTRGVKTLPLRIEYQSNSAENIASKLLNHPLINTLNYPFLRTHSSKEIAKKQMRLGGSMITMKLKLNKEETFLFCKKLKFFTLAESLGGVESLVSHPSTMSHASVDKKTKESIGITDSLIRFSIGCEDSDDLFYDLKQALDQFK
tara:strand:- start:3519 stop:4679 length:1161 start_codon:yes stop_codon:yes gene_type:complete